MRNESRRKMAKISIRELMRSKNKFIVNPFSHALNILKKLPSQCLQFLLVFYNRVKHYKCLEENKHCLDIVFKLIWITFRWVLCMASCTQHFVSKEHSHGILQQMMLLRASTMKIRNFLEKQRVWYALVRTLQIFHKMRRTCTIFVDHYSRSLCTRFF